MDDFFFFFASCLLLYAYLYVVLDEVLRERVRKYLILPRLDTNVFSALACLLVGVSTVS